MNLRVPPPLVGLICALIVWLCYRYLPNFDVRLPYQTLIAAAIALVGIGIDLFSVGQFFRNGTTITPIQPHKANSLVVSGFYRFSRNPMYLGMLFILIGWAVYVGNLIGIAGPIMFVWYITRFQIRPEEAALHQKFGQAYEDYRKRVRRWL